MSAIFTVFPREKMKYGKIDAELYGDGKGNCVYIYFDDDYKIIIHYGNLSNQNDFLTRLKQVINALENNCSKCGQSIP